MAVKKSALYGSLWAMADELRGGMDASQYKDYILVLLFMKYVSDRYAGNPDAAILVPEGASYTDMLRLRGDPQIGDSVNKIIAKLAEANGLSGVITVANFNDPEKLGSGRELVEKVSRLLSIFDRPELDLSRNGADGDDLLGDAYEYLMRHFATESGKSKGQFYTPAEVSRIMAHLVGAAGARSASETVYDPTCGSGSLLLKVRDLAPHGLTVYGQEKDVATRALAVMNMVLHGEAGAEIRPGNTLAAPALTDVDGRVRTFDYVVANPPFSDKAWLNGVDPANDARFRLGTPPRKQGDYAYLLHVLASMKSKARAVVVLPHGVLFRGGAEAGIRRQLVERGWIAKLVGLPPNLFYGTGIPACLVVLDKSRVAGAPVHMIDASRGFAKDGPKNRLRHQDVHRIVDVAARGADAPGYARLVPYAEIEQQGFNLNLPRYVDAGRRADAHDIAAHLWGGVPEADVAALGEFWATMPALRGRLFGPGDRSGALRPLISPGEVAAVVGRSPEMAALRARAALTFGEWRLAQQDRLESIAVGDRPKALIEAISEELLERFRAVPLLDPYAVYQRLMAYWDEVVGDDVGVLARDGWAAAARIGPPEKGEAAEVTLGGKPKRRLKGELIPTALLAARFFLAEAAEADRLEVAAETLAAEVAKLADEEGGDEGMLVEGLDEKAALTERSVKARMRAIREETGTPPRGTPPDSAGALREEFDALVEALALLGRLKAAEAAAKAGREAVNAASVERYATLTEAESKALLVEDKWLATLEAAVDAEAARVGAGLSARVRELVERYIRPLPVLVQAVDDAAERVRDHLRTMGFVWS